MIRRFDALVIGSGPTGAAAALYLARFGLNVGLVEMLAPGGMLLQTNDIENYPGFPTGIRGYELADAIMAQLEPYQNLTHISEEVQELDLEAATKRAKIGDSWVEAQSVLICSGVAYRKMGLPGEEKFLGKGVSHCALCDGNFFRNQVVGVVGGGNSALEESLYLSKTVSKLHLIHRRDSFSAVPVYQDKIRHTENIVLELGSVVSALHGNNLLEGVTIKRLASGKEDFIPLSGLFVFIGFTPRGDFLPEGLNRDSQGFLITDTEMRTNIPGVFAAGDIRAKLCRQVVTAVGDGATAANAAFSYLEQQHG